MDRNTLHRHGEISRIAFLRDDVEDGCEYVSEDDSVGSVVYRRNSHLTVWRAGAAFTDKVAKLLSRASCRRLRITYEARGQRHIQVTHIPGNRRIRPIVRSHLERGRCLIRVRASLSLSRNAIRLQRVGGKSSRNKPKLGGARAGHRDADQHQCEQRRDPESADAPLEHQRSGRGSMINGHFEPASV
ncbi:hypothetical protein [Conexibacter stalactiti]|uniref:hypothetical protein n=1 Tax=Conexibacter stalactiti TaxID=1940611 RepID=UPI00298CA31D|nr:hypothetical protein [Conexibacter stalactiti]